MRLRITINHNIKLLSDNCLIVQINDTSRFNLSYIEGLGINLSVV